MEKYYCSKCNSDIEEKVYNYSKKNHGKVLCRDCQPDTKPKKMKKGKSKAEKKKVLVKKKSYNPENMIKGRIAETLTEELFLSLGYNVFRYGMENTVPGIMSLLKGVRSDVATDIRRMPDFVIQHPERKDVYFIEVKFRASEEFSRKDLPKNYPYENAYFILVSKKHIKCITYEELDKKGKEITPNSQNYLGNRKEFIKEKEDKKIIINFCDFAIKFFQGV